MAIDLDRVFAQMRPGQEGAIKTIVSRVKAGESRTSIVLPTRYGKTDVARVAAAYCAEQGLVATSLFLTVSEYLRGQAAHHEKWQEALTRYGITFPMPTRPIRFPGVRYDANGERFLVTTIQLVQLNIDNFCMWADSVFHRTGLGVLVFVDECHTGSEKNSWGSTATRLTEHHCHVVLLTATAVRGDGEKIEGFEWEVLERHPDEWTTTQPSADPDMVTVKFWDGEKRKIKLKADWETTFREAWRETPSPLCKLSRVPFDVDLMRVDAGLSQKERAGWLSRKSEQEARSLLGRLVRDVRVIRDGVERLIRELRLLRRVHPNVGGIVFCGNDTEAGGQNVNEHVKAVVREIERQAPDLNCIVATMNEGEEAAKYVQRFADANVGDILIVKQMASLGMDAPRLKVCLDLSPVRQDASCLQRWFRVGTPFDRLNVGVLIHPDDSLGRELFRAWVENGGGSQQHRVGDVIKTIEVPKKPETPKPLTLVSGTAPADFEDTNLNKAEADLQGVAYFLCQRFPLLLSEYSHAEIAELTRGMRVDEEASGSSAAAIDLGAAIEGEQDDIVLLMDEVMRVRYPPSRAYDPKEYQQTRRDLWAELYASASVAMPKGGIRHITDRTTLARLKVVAEFIHSREISGVE